MSTTCGLIKAIENRFTSTRRAAPPCRTQATSGAMRERRRLDAEHRQRNLLRLWAFTVSSA